MQPPDPETIDHVLLCEEREHCEACAAAIDLEIASLEADLSSLGETDE